MKTVRVLVITGSRAEYGLLKPLMRRLRTDAHFTLLTAATGSHLSTAHGETFKAIEADGFRIDEKLPILDGDDSAAGVTRALARATEGFAGVFERLRPDVAVVLGDRYEILAAAQAALLARVPLAHVAGGDVTEGAFDESIRHAITKMAHLHFTTHEAARRRVIGLGEDPRRVFNVGSPAKDAILEEKLLTRHELEDALGFRFQEKNLLVTFHPTTLDAASPEEQFGELLAALDALDAGTGVLLTRPNADPGASGIARLAEEFVRTRPHAAFFASLGQAFYWSAMKETDAVVGNSSSGLYEAPFFGKPTVNIGDRQKGRLRASSTIDCLPERHAIADAVRRALTSGPARENPYQGEGIDAIVRVLKGIESFKALLRKPFFDSSAPMAGKTLIIAEAGVNHDGSEEKALRLIDAAAAAGADAVKFQTFRAEALASLAAEKALYQKKNNAFETQREMLKRLELGEASFAALAAHAKKKGIEFLSTAFDESSLDVVLRLGVRRLKVPSGEITNGPLLFRIARQGLPVLVSTGMATMAEIEAALAVLAFGFVSPDGTPSRKNVRRTYESPAGRAALKEKVTLLQCTTAYPAPEEDLNLLAMDDLRDTFGVPVGFSDHSAGITAAVVAAARGAAVIEKHLTLDRAASGPDHAASLDPEDFRRMVDGVRAVARVLGRGGKRPVPSELSNRPAARKSLVTRARVKKGETFSEENLTVKRPGTGASPMEYWERIGSAAARDYEADEVVE